MRADDLDHAIDLVNQTGYGLTSGIESLDEREQQHWRERIRAGNLYINRVTTGAIVLRQPFGGMGKSAFGPGIKAGGPNYVAQLMDFIDTGVAAQTLTTELPDDTADSDSHTHATQADHALGVLPGQSNRLRQHSTTPTRTAQAAADPLIAGLLRVPQSARAADPADHPRLAAAFASYRQAIDSEFAREHDHVRLIGQDNLRRYLPVAKLCIRLHHDDSLFDCAARLLASSLLHCGATVSIPVGTAGPGFDWLHELLLQSAHAPPLIVEDDSQLAERILVGEIERIRYAAPERVPKAIFEAATQIQTYIARAPVLAEGRIELLWYLREQSISRDYHRYGNLGERGAEARTPVP
jgi:RHH-type proline utilization regulon transcriptional repressor/proline dehydrogenase/delta 1-pyrroline-5-carboxylate dehydrogenase